jgi:NAD(P)-dependent dehydrogenase (short-subunit alcohol dehydrogenase family)
MNQLTGKVALVTGAGGQTGLGRAIACRLAQDGADIAVSDLDDQASDAWPGLPAVVAEIEAMGRSAIGVKADVTDSAQVENLVLATLERFGRIDILVNNAGAPAGPDRVPVVELDEDVFDLVQRVNVKGTFLVSRAVARHMIGRGEGGNIINMSSLAGRRGKARYAAYCASKFAIIGFTQSLACELGEHGIRVNAICPALVDNERVYAMAAGLRPEGVSIEQYHDDFVDRFSETNPLGRLATTGDVADTAAWLASDQSRYITAQAINVTGGDELK